MPNAFFISENYLKTNSPMSKHIEMEEVYPFAFTAEETYMQIAIGTRLYDRLVESLEASPPNTTANEKILIKKIRSCLVWYACVDALPFLATKIRNIGVVKQTSETTTPAEDQTVKDLIKKCKDKGDFYLENLQRYLCENSHLFPEYQCSGWNCSEIMPNTNVSNTSDLAIDRESNRNDIDARFARKWLNGL